jgi:phosphoribosylamine--glycine ligase
MNVLVIGSGAREHAICWRLAASRRVSKVFCAPGNPGIASVAEIVPVAVTAVSELLTAAERLGVGITVVGPEAALEAGVVDAFRAAGRAIVGPTKEAAMLETSKAFAKEIMIAAGVPTAKHEVFHDRASLERRCKEQGAPLVLKADGLASGKGVFVIEDAADFPAALDALFGPIKAERVVVEEFLTGVEVSCIFAANGSEVLPLAPAHDYKRLGEDDRGPNTGGMGSVCPSPRISESELAWIQEHCAAPILRVMRERGTPFSGFLYAGLMVPTDPAKRPDGIRVLEYNTRLGDPECQAILSRLASDPLELMEWIAGERATQPKLAWRPEVSTCVVVASDGYPEAPAKGDQITGLDLAALVPSTVVFHAATTRDSRGNLVSGGGRTLTVVGLGADYGSARSAAYKAVDLVQLRGRRVRRDIGA